MFGIGGIGGDWGALPGAVAGTLGGFDNEQELLNGVGTLLVLFAGMTADLTQRAAELADEDPQEYLSRLEDALNEWLGPLSGEEA